MNQENDTNINNENTQANFNEQGTVLPYINNNVSIGNIENSNINNNQNIKNEISSENKNTKVEKEKSCKEKYPFCFCKIKCAYFVDYCNKAEIEKYKNKPTTECCCIITVLYYLTFILS